MEIPRRYIDNFTRGINTISEGAREALARELAALDYSDMTQAINDAVALLESYCSATSEAAARLAAQFYRGMSMIQTGEDYEAEAISGHIPVATEKAVRGIAQQGVDGDIAGMIKQLAERVDYEAKRAAGETVMGNARRDRRRVRYARVPSGNETCMFCIMLASRGFVYHSAESAGELNHYHANCDCRIVPSFAAVTVPGYDPAEYYRIWKSGVLPQAETDTDENALAVEFKRKKGNSTPAQDVKATNPNFSTGKSGYRRNCQRCVPTYEMRRRGYDVVAKPRGGRFDPTARAWKDIFEGAEWISCNGTGKGDIEDHLRQWGDGARAEVYVRWARGRSSHVFVAENDGGTIRYYDPQSGSVDCSEYFKHVELRSTQVCRIDNLEPSAYIDWCCEDA